MEQRKSPRSFTIQFNLSALEFLKTHVLVYIQHCNIFTIYIKQLENNSKLIRNVFLKWRTENLDWKHNMKREMEIGRNSMELEDKLVEYRRRLLMCIHTTVLGYSGTHRSGVLHLHDWFIPVLYGIVDHIIWSPNTQKCAHVLLLQYLHVQYIHHIKDAFL